MESYSSVVYAAAAYGTGSSENAAKRMRLSDDPCKPSRVLHLRGLPPDTTEAEITQLTVLFGVATNIILTRSKNQALVEMADLATAQQMVDYYKHMPARIRSQPIHIQFSMHERLKNAAQPPGNPAEGDGPNTVLRVIVDNMLYPITLDTLHMLFVKYGEIHRVITFNKNNSFQALIEFADGLSAQAAKVALNGQNIYNGCCSLHIDFSKLKRLSVRYNNDKSRDYTNPHLGTGNDPPNPPDAGNGIWGPYPGFNMPGGIDPNNPMFGFFPGMQGPGGNMAPAANMPMPPYGFQGMPMAGGQMPCFNPAMGAPPFVPPGGAPFVPAMPGAGIPQQQPSSGTVVLVSNLDPEKVTPDGLFTLFGMYGDVTRVKILFNKKDTALIQFVEASHAQRAISNLDYITLYGKQLKLTASKHSSVQMPKEGTLGAELTQDYANSPLHRFRNPQSKNHLHIVPPSSVLHLSNIPASTSENDLRSMFIQFGGVNKFRQFEKDQRMALIQMESVEAAIEALIGLHNFDFGNGNHLRVTFTKSVIGSP